LSHQIDIIFYLHYTLPICYIDPNSFMKATSLMIPKHIDQMLSMGKRNLFCPLYCWV